MNVKDRDGFGKATLNVNGKDIHMSMPFAKVDKSARTVSGFATLDNIDTQGDVVLAEASVKAFSRARGNIREQHDPYKAVGRMVDFREEEFYHSDPETGEGKFYKGIFVTARVSEGAEDTWKKVLDAPSVASLSVERLWRRRTSSSRKPVRQSSSSRTTNSLNFL